MVRNTTRQFFLEYNNCTISQERFIVRTRIYTRNSSGVVVKYDAEGKITHEQAKQSLKSAKIAHKGAIMLVYFTTKEKTND